MRMQSLVGLWTHAQWKSADISFQMKNYVVMTLANNNTWFQ